MPTINMEPITGMSHFFWTSWLLLFFMKCVRLANKKLANPNRTAAIITLSSNTILKSIWGKNPEPSPS